MKKIHFLLIAVMMTVTANAQNTFFPTKTGTVLLYVQNDAKGKAGSYTRHTITDVEGSGTNMTISYVMESLDKNRKPLSDPPMEFPCKVIIKDDVVILDMNQMFAGQLKDAMMKVEFTGVPMELPSDLQPGHTIKDAEITMNMDLGIMKMKTTMKTSDGKCLAIEDVTVPAGTFRCHKVTQTVTTTTTVMKKDVKSTAVSWYAPGVGTIKTESYSDKDKLQSSMELVEMK